MFPLQPGETQSTLVDSPRMACAIAARSIPTPWYEVDSIQSAK